MPEKNMIRLIIHHGMVVLSLILSCPSSSSLLGLPLLLLSRFVQLIVLVWFGFYSSIWTFECICREFQESQMQWERSQLEHSNFSFGEFSFKVITFFTLSWSKLPRFALNTILTVGGYSHAPDGLSYGVDMKRIRWMGILQVLSIHSSIPVLVWNWYFKLLFWSFDCRE